MRVQIYFMCLLRFIITIFARLIFVYESAK